MPFRWVFYCVLICKLCGCAYRFGYSERVLPGGYEQIAIPIFTNRTMETGIETYFTNEMIRQFARSKVARVTAKNLAPVTLEGEIKRVEYLANAQVNRLANLPKDSVLTTEYRLIVNATVQLRRNSDRKIIWEGSFREEKVYQSPQVAIATLNSANPLYNQSARHQNIAQLAQSMMAEAHDRMTENF